MVCPACPPRTPVMPRIALLLATLLTSACTTLPDAGGDADARLIALYEDEYAWRQEQQGRERDDSGRWVAGARYPDVSPEAYAERLAYWNEALAALAQIPRDALSPEEQINAAVFEQIVTSAAEDARFRTYEAPLNSDSFFWSYLAPRRGFGDLESYERYVNRLNDLPRYFDQHIANMRAGLARGYTPPAVTLQGRDGSIVAFLREGVQNPFAAAVARFPNNMTAEEQARTRDAVMKAIETAVIPAFAELLSFMQDEYQIGRASCRERV